MTNQLKTEYALTKSMFCDVKFIVGENEEEINANSFMLAVASSVFEKMFFGQLNNEREINIPDVSRDSFYQLIKFIYTETVDITLDNVIEIIYLAKKYLILSLENWCNEFGLKNLSMENVFETLEAFGTEKGSLSLREECLTIIRYNTGEILESSCLFDHAELNTILGLNSLSISENTLCKLIFKDNTSGKLIRQKLGDSFYLIRFLTLSVEEFLEIVYKFKDMFTAEEAISMLMKISLAADTSDIRFSSIPRTLLQSLKSRHLNSLDINTLAGTLVYSKIDWKEIKFSVNKKIWIFGVDVFPKHGSNSMTIVNIKLIDGNGDTITEKIDKYKNTTSGSTFKVNFGRACRMKANTDYKICIRYDVVGDFYYGINNHPPKRSVGGIEFDFKYKDSAFNTLYFKV